MKPLSDSYPTNARQRAIDAMSDWGTADAKERKHIDQMSRAALAYIAYQSNDQLYQTRDALMSVQDKLRRATITSAAERSKLFHSTIDSTTQPEITRANISQAWKITDPYERHQPNGNSEQMIAWLDRILAPIRAELATRATQKEAA